MAKSFLEGYQTYDTGDGYGNAHEWKGAFKGRMSKEDATAFFNGQPQTPHEILNVPLGATAAGIKKAFRRLMMEWHPDRNQHRAAEAEEMSKKIIAAYTVLTR
ncbi:J domain-containing protein [Chitinophaga sp. Ak27]|uniref:J domain-containing protein n=1 Tax=Chitinophaga sp. Ak27 TaxID=2726116 RepID=UPI00145E6A30|nr:J domain-containing protein [Chitinophaga sp. Ak27]NLU91366.1 J domain-containing protein [Chitinophaga sp. Ak27]